ncbi:MAG TPA: DNA primase [Gemmatimonadales bacterium]|nr:DNA primase [Gemmatimonadales bacterium]
MSLIPDELIEQIREAADLVGIIGESVELKRTGADFRGPCPFHGGTHRNFAVIPRKGMFHCFVCHASGDVFTYFMKRLGMDYPTAVREVARRTGITIPERGPAGPDPREPLFSAVAAAHDWFARALHEGEEAEPARAYLLSRKITLEQATELGLGYAPRGAAFAAAMQALGIEEPVLLEAGLLRRRDDGVVVPRFRGRLLFPIHDLRGRVVAFGGRILGEGEPKYLNSPETPIFHKGKLLYHLHAARHAMRKAERALLVEGYFDVIRPALAGIEEVVAPMGTGLTPDQAELLRRYAPQVVLCYDSDDAGLRATFRAGDELLRAGVRVSVATLPEGEDPDTLVQRDGAAGLEAVLRDAVDVLERKIQILERKRFFETLPGRRRALDRLLPTIRATSDPITRELYISRVAEVAHIRKDVLERETGMGDGGRGTSTAASPPVPRPSSPVPNNGERAVLLVMLAGDAWRARVLEKVDPEDIEHPVYRRVFESLVEGQADGLEGQEARVYEALRAEAGVTTEPDALFDRAVNWIEARRLDRELERLEREIPLASGAEQDRLVRDVQRVSAERNKLFPRYKIASRRSGAPGS